MSQEEGDYEVRPAELLERLRLEGVSLAEIGDKSASLKVESPDAVDDKAVSMEHIACVTKDVSVEETGRKIDGSCGGVAD